MATSPLRRVIALGLVAVAAIALTGCSFHSTPEDIGGVPTGASQTHVTRVAVQGLRDHDESEFGSAVDPKELQTAKKAWAICTPALMPGATITYNDRVVSGIVGIMVHPKVAGGKGCWVSLLWSEKQGWSMDVAVATNS